MVPKKPQNVHICVRIVLHTGKGTLSQNPPPWRSIIAPRPPILHPKNQFGLSQLPITTSQMKARKTYSNSMLIC